MECIGPCTRARLLGTLGVHCVLRIQRNTSTMKTTCVTFIAFAVIHAASADAAVIVDQQYLDPVTRAVSTDDPGQMGKSFPPTLSFLQRGKVP